MVGITVAARDKGKIHVVKNKDKYHSLTDLVSKAVERQVDADDTTTTN
jgi:hypothetical protein